MEALASGTSAIVFDNSGTAEIINKENFGATVQQENFRAFALAALAWAKRGLVDTNVERCCVQRSQEFSYRISARSYMNLYEQILSEKVS